MQSYVDNFLSETAPLELEKSAAYVKLGNKKLRDMRGTVRFNFNKYAELYFLNGEDDWPVNDTELIEDAKCVMQSVFKGKFKLSDDDIRYAKVTLEEWIDNDGKLDPKFKGNSSNDSDSDSEFDSESKKPEIEDN